MSKFLSSTAHRIPDQFIINSLFNEDYLKMKISQLFSSIQNMDGSDEILTTLYSLPNADAMTHPRTKFAHRKGTNIIAELTKRNK